MLTERRYADEVRADEAHWQAEGIASVPTIIIDGKFLISGAQSSDRYERAVRKIVFE